MTSSSARNEPAAFIACNMASNPPYIALEEYENLPAGVKNYEPAEALLDRKNRIGIS